jgi:hypothetical protein
MYRAATATPARASRARATAESTPPDSPTTTSGAGAARGARLGDDIDVCGVFK